METKKRKSSKKKKKKKTKKKERKKKGVRYPVRLTEQEGTEGREPPDREI